MFWGGGVKSAHAKSIPSKIAGLIFREGSNLV